MKRRGKSSPRAEEFARQEKPHAVQDKTGGGQPVRQCPENSGPIFGYRRTTLRENVAGVRRNPDEINDRPVRLGGRTEFGLPPSNMKGASETERPSLIERSSLGGFFYLIHVFFNFLNLRMQFFENFGLFAGKFFDAPGLLM